MASQKRDTSTVILLRNNTADLIPICCAWQQGTNWKKKSSRLTANNGITHNPLVKTIYMSSKPSLGRMIFALPSRAQIDGLHAWSRRCRRLGTGNWVRHFVMLSTNTIAKSNFSKTTAALIRPMSLAKPDQGKPQTPMIKSSLVESPFHHMSSQANVFIYN